LNESEKLILDTTGFDSTQYSGIIIGIVAFVVGILVGKSLHRKGSKTSVKLKTKKVIKPELKKSSEPETDLSKGVKLDQEYTD